jgi:hypothetical protein
VGVALLSMLLY